MNLADTEIIQSIMEEAGFERTGTLNGANIIFANTCAVRESAEQRVMGRLGKFSELKKRNPDIIIGLLGCMAERIGDKIPEYGGCIDFIAGPDEYRKLPELIRSAEQGIRGIAVNLSHKETYDDIIPVRRGSVSAWIPIMRGCDKFCSYCIVPYTRGRERSRSIKNITGEVENLSELGYKEITLLGQNVNSFSDGGRDFTDLLSEVSKVDQKIRIRFTTSHPQDMPTRLIDLIASTENLCNYIHLPVQSGSDRILELMNRKYTSRYYLDLISRIRRAVPDVFLSTDLITGYPTETEDDHKMTIELIREAGFDGAFTFRYSPREGTRAWEAGNDIPEETKVRRLNEIIGIQRSISLQSNKKMIGKIVEVLVEGPSRKSDSDFCGRTGTNRMVVFPGNGDSVGDLIPVRIASANSATLFGAHVPKAA
jgi:tRNA-2-methylthio-N6-dimethylallyladenosine synthase